MVLVYLTKGGEKMEIFSRIVMFNPGNEPIEFYVNSTDMGKIKRAFDSGKSIVEIKNYCYGEASGENSNNILLPITNIAFIEDEIKF